MQEAISREVTMEREVATMAGPSASYSHFIGAVRDMDCLPLYACLGEMADREYNYDLGLTIDPSSLPCGATALQRGALFGEESSTTEVFNLRTVCGDS